MCSLQCFEEAGGVAKTGLNRPGFCFQGFARDVTPFFRSESYESRLAASVSWQEDCEYHDEKEEAAFAGANRSENSTG